MGSVHLPRLPPCTSQPLTIPPNGMSDALIFETPLVVIDVETWCPGRGHRHRIVEIGAAVYDRRGHIVRGGLAADGTSRPAGGSPQIFEQLCRPAGFPRRVRLHNAVKPHWLWKANVASERDVVQRFADWHYRVGGWPLVAYNHGFDRSALHGALSEAEGWPLEDAAMYGLPWAECLMQMTRRVLQLPKRVSKETAAQMVGLPPLQALAKAAGYAGPMTMHRGLPDVLLEGALLVALSVLDRQTGGNAT